MLMFLEHACQSTLIILIKVEKLQTICIFKLESSFTQLNQIWLKSHLFAPDSKFLLKVSLSVQKLTNKPFTTRQVTILQMKI